MKTFKLLQLYPSLSKNWEVGMEVGLGDRNYGYLPCSGNYTDYKKLDNPEVENNPDFWEEVIIKEYEIVGFHKGDNKITSIKRLSDGEIFSVGDDVLSKSCSVPNKILSIQIINNEIRLYPRNSFYRLNEITKFKQPLFTTNDGVKVFDGDSYWFIYPQFTVGFVERATDVLVGDLGTFSTEIAAKKFIKENEKKYSLNDMTKIANHWAFIKGQPNNDNTLKIIEKWEK